jgi:hypothetical protein
LASAHGVRGADPGGREVSRCGRCGNTDVGVPISSRRVFVRAVRVLRVLRDGREVPADALADGRDDLADLDARDRGRVAVVNAWLALTRTEPDTEAWLEEQEAQARRAAEVDELDELWAARPDGRDAG